jgi:hypothetical protein
VKEITKQNVLKLKNSNDRMIGMDIGDLLEASPKKRVKFA